MATTGTATIDFGALPGTNEASVIVTGQTLITSTNAAEAYFMLDSTSDHTINDHKYAALLIKLICSVPTNGTGFTIYAVSTEKITGTYSIRWVWA